MKENNISRSKKIAYISTFGCLSGITEITMGSWLHAFRVPFTGVIMGAIFVIILLIARFIIMEKGSTLTIGLIAAFLKLFSIGSVVTGPLIAIISQALIAEILLSFIGINIAGFLITPAMTLLFNCLYPFISQTLMLGTDIVKVYTKMIIQGAQLFSLPVESGWIILGLFILIHLTAGIISGVIAWKLSHQIKLKLGI